ncbi:MAG: DNA polymerase [bacterium]|nr:DNA polymerase [bacterium]
MAVKNKILVLLDAHAILHRAFHALPAFSSPKGEPTGALYGFVAFLLKVLRELKPDYIAACYDLPGPTFRHAAYKKYKGQRPELASDLTSQISRSYDLLQAFSVPVFEHPRFEADDILGTIVEKVKTRKNLDVIIASGDLDTLQLVSGRRVRVYTLRKGLQDTVLYDEEKVRERFGFGPEYLPDFKGLKGDPSDNIIGVPGIGDKTASELVQKFGTLEKIFKALKKDKKSLVSAGIKDRTIKLLEEHEEEALFSKTLTEIRRDAPIEFLLEKTDWRGNYKKERAELLFKELGFTSLLSRLPAASEADSAAQKKEEVETESNPELLEKERERFWYFLENAKKLYAVSAGGKIFSAEGGPASGGENHFFDAKKIFHVFNQDQFPYLTSDLKISAWLARPALQNPSLFEVIHNFLPKESLAESEIFKALRCLPALSQVLGRELREKKLERVLNEIELPLIPVLCEMERRGILVDVKSLGKLSTEFQKQLEKYQEKIWKFAGLSFNINSPSQLAEVLFGRLKLEARGIKKTPGGARSTRESELLKLKNAHPVIKELLSYRELSKLKSTYLDALPSLADASGRVHTTFDQTGTVTGRLSSLEPNLQNIPIRSEAGREVRKAFIASKGFSLVSFDYSQLELRIAAILSSDRKMKRAFQEGKDIHAATAAEIFNVPEEEITPEMRRDAKVINFGILYGMGVNTLARSMEVSRERAEAFWQEYFQDFEGVAEYIAKIKKEVRAKGYVETLFGRRRYLPEIFSSAEYIQKEAERMAVNAPIQGTEADIVKLGMIRAQNLVKENFSGEAHLLLQIHDELLFEVKKERVKDFVSAVRKILEEIYKGDITLTVEAKVGDNWAELKKL